MVKRLTPIGGEICAISSVNDYHERDGCGAIGKLGDRAGDRLRDLFVRQEMGEYCPNTIFFCVAEPPRRSE